jgi:hypothetical protein
VDHDGIESTQQEAECTHVDTRGRRLKTYGSGGWVFESPPGALHKAW